MFEHNNNSTVHLSNFYIKMPIFRKALTEHLL